MIYQWATLIQQIKGIGPTRAKELEGMGIKTVGNLLETTPNYYIYPGTTSIADATEGYVVIRAKITQIGRLPTRVLIVEARLDDGTGRCKAVWYNQQYAMQHLRPGMVVTLWGKMHNGALQQPRFTTAQPNWSDIAGGLYGVHNETIRAALKEVLANVELPSMVDGFDRATAFAAFHFPVSEESWQQALIRLKFDEALCHQFAMAERRKHRFQQHSQPIAWGLDTDRKIKSFIPFVLTTEQQVAVLDVVSDMASTTPMSRLLHGEVGSGKTVVMFYAAMLAALDHKRTLILCPTTILAQQHFDTLQGMGWCDVRLHGQPASTNACIIIGTHSILNDEQLLASASLVIVDEFHKFGVEQRAQATKHSPHLLLVSATPIPRTLSLSVFGDLDVSTIREQPTARGQVITCWVLPEKREAMYEIVEQELEKRHQAYVVYPRIGDEEQEQSAISGYSAICERFSNYCVALLTGKSKEKTATIQQFLKGNIVILVSTIIAEVGLDCPNATVMIVEGADRFGLSQLHQLRGRICRAKDTAYCFLVSDTANDTSIARLEVVEKINNGFDIAEHDLRLRGPGEMLGTEQHGVPGFKFLSLVDDYDIMVKAKNAVSNNSINDGVREMAQIKYGGSLNLGDIK